MGFADLAVSGELVNEVAEELGSEPVLELLNTWDELAAEPMEARLLVFPRGAIGGDSV